jgi:hypothetical protein
VDQQAETADKDEDEGEVAPAPPRPRRARRPPRKSSPYGRLYLGVGGGYLWPTGEIGTRFESTGLFAAWAGWRKRWLGFEVGYLGAQLLRNWEEVPAVPPPAGETAGADGLTTTTAEGDAFLHQLTADAKLFLTVFCRSSVYARLGLNYTRLDYGHGVIQDGFGWQTGAGWDYRIRLSWWPDVILKLRAEALYTWARLRCGEGQGCRDLAGVAGIFYVNLGWSPHQ